jgi:uncharacterized protein YbcI
MPGFEYRYRQDGGQPTIRSFAFVNTATLSRGDMLNFEHGQVDLGARGDVGLLGAAMETIDGEANISYMRVITDADAVYAVEDAHARRKGDTLDLTGATDAQGVATSAASEFEVVADSLAAEATLVTIGVASHHRLGPDEGRRRPTGGELNAAIARAVVRYHRAHTGRGPTKAQTFHRNNVIVVLLEEMMTKAERSLIAGGKADAVRLMREAFQDTMRPDMVATVEELTGAKVRAFLSTNELDPDIAVEVFVLDRPVTGEPPEPDG